MSETQQIHLQATATHADRDMEVAHNHSLSASKPNNPFKVIRQSWRDYRTARKQRKAERRAVKPVEDAPALKLQARDARTGTIGRKISDASSLLSWRRSSSSLSSLSWRSFSSSSSRKSVDEEQSETQDELPRYELAATVDLEETKKAARSRSDTRDSCPKRRRRNTEGTTTELVQFADARPEQGQLSGRVVLLHGIFLFFLVIANVYAITRWFRL